MFVASPESDMEWSNQGVEGSHRFLQKIARISDLAMGRATSHDEHKRNTAIKKYTDLLEKFKFNLAVVELMAYADYLSDHPTRLGYEDILKMLSPFAPHLAEEMWEKLGNKGFISLQEWPGHDNKKIAAEFEVID